MNDELRAELRAFCANCVVKAETEIEALRREIAAQHLADKLALELAERALSARLERMNEFREQLLEERRQYIRVDTFRWTVGFLVSFIVAAIALVRLLR